LIILGRYDKKIETVSKGCMILETVSSGHQLANFAEF